MRSTRALAALTAAAAVTPAATAFAADPDSPVAPAAAATAALTPDSPAATAAAATAALTPDSPAATAAVAPAALTPDFAGDATLRQQMHRHARRQAHRRLVARYEHTARRHDERPRRRAARWSDRRLREEIRDLRRPERAPAPAAATGGGPTGHLAAIAQCESGGDPSAIGGGGTYRGMYQFSYETWRAVGGTGDPAAASVAEQTRRAQILYEQAGPSQWPVCGQ